MSHSCTRHSYRSFLVWATGVSLLGLMGCSSQLPAATPDALGLIADRVELNAIATYSALDNSLINAQFSKKEVAGAKKLIKGIDSSGLSTTDKASLQSALNLLTSAETGLATSKEILEVRDGLNARAGAIVAKIQLIQAILAKKVGQDEIMNNIVTQVRKTIESDKNNG